MMIRYVLQLESNLKGRGRVTRWFAGRPWVFTHVTEDMREACQFNNIVEALNQKESLGDPRWKAVPVMESD